MPRLHSVSQYHSQPSIKQSPVSNMSPLPLLHLIPRNSPLKTRPATPIHFQNPACPSIKPRQSPPNPSNPIRSSSAISTRPKRLPKPIQNPQPAEPLPTTPSIIKPSNRKPTSKRTRKNRQATPCPASADQPSSLLYNLSFPEPHQTSIDAPDRLTNTSPTPRISEMATKPQVLSLSDFCDQLTVQVHDPSFESTSRPSKKKPSSRKSKKGGQRRAPLCPPLSDCEDVLSFDHSMFLSHECPSRSATPSPINISESSALDRSTLILDHAQLASSPAASKPSSDSDSSLHRPSDSPASLPPRHHVRAKSVASIFDSEKPLSPSKMRGAKDDWDMPSAAPAQGLTWQQTQKKANKTGLSASTGSQLAQKLAQHDTKSPPAISVSPNHSSKDTSARRQRTALARTSSATTLSRPTPTPAATPKPNQTYSSRSDDESAMTWQQSILRPSLRHTLLASRSDQPASPFENKPCNPKNAAPTSSKTPIKAPSIPRRAGINSAVKPRSSGPFPTSNKRRNSLSSTRTPAAAQALENTPFQDKSRSLGLKSGENIFADWKSFSTGTADDKATQPIFSNPLPILGAQVDYNTPNRRHAKSYTHQPAVSTQSMMQHPSQPNNSAPVFSPMTDPQVKVMTPSKPRSTSEDLHLATPGNKFSSPALRAAFMYAGPQFHNSPRPAALPAPKFSFGSA